MKKIALFLSLIIVGISTVGCTNHCENGICNVKCTKCVDCNCIDCECEK